MPVKKTNEHMQMEQSHVYGKLYLKDWTVSPKNTPVGIMNRHIERVQVVERWKRGLKFINHIDV